MRIIFITKYKKIDCPIEWDISKESDVKLLKKTRD